MALVGSGNLLIKTLLFLICIMTSVHLYGRSIQRPLCFDLKSCPSHLIPRAGIRTSTAQDLVWGLGGRALLSGATTIGRLGWYMLYI